MRISCALAASDLNGKSSDLIVLPEYSTCELIYEVSSQHPNAMVVAAVEEEVQSPYGPILRSRGVLYHRGENRIDYLKVSNDGHTRGTENTQQSPVFESEHACVGVLVCKDAIDPCFSPKIISKIRASASEIKVLCVPARMNAATFPNEPLDKVYRGLWFALCNSDFYEDRCKSFVANPHCTKVEKQKDLEPVFHTVIP